MLLRITNFPSHFLSLCHRESHCFIPRPHCCPWSTGLPPDVSPKACVSAHVDAGTAGPHSRILPAAPSLQVAREASPLEHTVLVTLLAPTPGSCKAFSDEILVPKRCEHPPGHCSKDQRHQGHFLIHQSSWQIRNPAVSVSLHSHWQDCSLTHCCFLIVPFHSTKLWRMLMCPELRWFAEKFFQLRFH